MVPSACYAGGMADGKDQELRQRASELRAEASALTRAYRRRTWVRFALVFIPVPLVLVLLRLEIEAWHYFLFGGAYVGLSALLYIVDGRESERCDAADKAAGEAERAANAAASTSA